MGQCVSSDRPARMHRVCDKRRSVFRRYDDTTAELVIINEWSRSRIQSDLAKILLQGGWMVTSVKHGVSRQVNNNSPFDITTNHVPDFGNEDELPFSTQHLCLRQFLASTAGSIMRCIALPGSRRKSDDIKT